MIESLDDIFQTSSTAHWLSFIARQASFRCGNYNTETFLHVRGHLRTIRSYCVAQSVKTPPLRLEPLTYRSMLDINQKHYLDVFDILQTADYQATKEAYTREAN